MCCLVGASRWLWGALLRGSESCLRGLGREFQPTVKCQFQLCQHDTGWLVSIFLLYRAVFFPVTRKIPYALWPSVCVAKCACFETIAQAEPSTCSAFQHAVILSRFISTSGSIICRLSVGISPSKERERIQAQKDCGSETVVH